MSQVNWQINPKEIFEKHNGRAHVLATVAAEYDDVDVVSFFIDAGVDPGVSLIQSINKVKTTGLSVWNSAVKFDSHKTISYICEILNKKQINRLMSLGAIGFRSWEIALKFKSTKSIDLFIEKNCGISLSKTFLLIFLAR